jgi:hypothetical protein
MRVIDAFTGRDVRIGDVVPSASSMSPGKTWKLVDVRDAFFRAYALLEYEGCEPRWTELHVRFTHPKYPWQRVAFVPT